MSEKQNLFAYIIGVSFLVLTTFGGSYAFLAASTSNNSIIKGEAYSFDLNLNLATIKNSTKLIPLTDSKIGAAISRTTPCIDNSGYEVCSLYKVTLTNNGSYDEFFGYITTNSYTYSSGSLKYQVFTKNGTTYTPVSDQIIISNTKDANSVMVKNATNVLTSLNAADKIDYYFAIWLTETGQSQSIEFGKNFNGSIGFASTHGDEVTSEINS